MYWTFQAAWQVQETERLPCQNLWKKFDWSTSCKWNTKSISFSPRSGRARIVESVPHAVYTHTCSSSKYLRFRFELPKTIERGTLKNTWTHECHRLWGSCNRLPMALKTCAANSSAFTSSCLYRAFQIVVRSSRERAINARLYFQYMNGFSAQASWAYKGTYIQVDPSLLQFSFSFYISYPSRVWTDVSVWIVADMCCLF